MTKAPARPKRPPDSDRRKASIRNIDHNAPAKAGVTQSAADAADKSACQPAEQGGRG
jgi:hypothetical protein